MSRTDKRAGRVKYIKGLDNEFTLLRKSLFGKDWNNKFALQMMFLFLRARGGKVEEYVRATSKIADKELVDLLAKMAGHMFKKGDGDGLQALGRMLNCCISKYADRDAAEIIVAYLEFLYTWFLKYKKDPRTEGDFPSGKDLAQIIDERRRRLKKDPSTKTHDAIRERALRLGLKLNGKRNKDK